MCIVIGVSGTPGVGKSYVSRRVSERLGAVYIDLSREVVERGLYSGYDEERGSYIADPEKINRYIEGLCEEYRDRYIVVDSHYPEVIDPRYISRIFVLRARPEKIARRLCERGWPREKILENIEAEILGVCLYNAVEEQGPGKVCEIYEEDLDKAVERILGVLAGREKCEILYIDWLSVPGQELPEEIFRRACAQSSS